MFFEKVRSEGLAQMSYIFGDAGQAAVIDPRRDCQIYRQIADREGCRITHIFETHRNEDFVIGSCELAAQCDASIHHGGELPFRYGKTVEEGDRFEFGNFHLTILKTPGHTDESISLVLADRQFSDQPLAVFTGDALFVGDVGRTDFFPDRAEEVAGLLYDSIFTKLLPLGEHVLIYPAHGAGSVCGGGLADREFSTLGYERRYNPALQVADRDAFIRRKTAESHNYAPYFKKMEELNLAGPPHLGGLPRPQPQAPDAFAKAMEEGMLAIDTRSPEAFSGAHLPGSLALPLAMIPAYAGWFLDYERPIGLIVGAVADVETATRYLLRLGYEKITAFLAQGLHAWEVSGREYEQIAGLTAKELKQWQNCGKKFTLLDVRQADEVNQGRLPDSLHIFLGRVPGELDRIPRDRPVVTFCGSGKRALIAASLLKREGFGQVRNCLGSMAACQAVGCSIES